MGSTTPPVRTNRLRPRLAGRSAKILATAAAGLLGLILIVAVWIARPLPEGLADPGQVPSLVIQDRNGLTLRATRSGDGSLGGWIWLADIDPDIIRAFIAVEDERFYEHGGVDIRAVVRAARDNLSAGAVVSGASTITMQTARLLRTIPRSWSGKVRQMLWARRLETHLDKQSILELYLNLLPLGQGTVGVSAAASLYFDASAVDVSLGQAALLAALAHAPSRDNPLVAPERAAARRGRVLERLGKLGYADGDAISRAQHEPLLAHPRRALFLAPHFTTRILQRAELAGVVLDGVWRASLDLDLQTALEAEVRHTVDVLTDQRVEHAAAVVLENRSGHVLAWVGSPDFWAQEGGQVDMVVSRRQPGSALKPFLYGLAFDRGYTAASVLPDIPRTYDTQVGAYTPRNYDRRFRGPVRVREALASSYNIPAVELADRLGAGALLSTLHHAGFASLDGSADHYGIGLALGNGEVTLIELANAYRALVAGGKWKPYRWLVSGPSLDNDGSAERRIFSEAAAYLVLDILDDPVARTPGFGIDTPFDFTFPVAAKTGTSRRFTDNWAVGATGGFTVAVWVGNFSGRPMAGVSGISGAGPLLHRAVLATARRIAPGLLPEPESAGVIPMDVCRLSGLAATPECPSLVEWFVPGTEPSGECDWHQHGRVVLPPEYAEWAARNGGHETRLATTRISHSGAPVGPSFRIVAPQEGDRYTRPPNTDPRYATISLRAVGAADIQRVRWWVDGIEIATPRWQLQPGLHTIRAEAASGDWDEVTILVER